MARSDDQFALSSIADVADEFGLTHRALRFYEQRGLLSPVRQGASRFYDSAQRRRLKLILRAKALGFTLTEVAQYLVDMEKSEDDENFVALIDRKSLQAQLRLLETQKAEIDAAIAELRSVLGTGRTARGSRRHSPAGANPAP